MLLDLSKLSGIPARIVDGCPRLRLSLRSLADSLHVA